MSGEHRDIVVQRIAHDLANLLTCIVASATHAATFVGDRERDLQAIRRAAELGGDLVRVLRHMERGDLPQACRVAGVVGPCATLLERVAAFRGVRLEVGLVEDVRAAIPAFELQEIVLNLGLNAIEALPADGTVRIDAVAQGEIVVVAIADDGPGIPSEAAPPREGHSHLGLASVQSITSAAGGVLDIATGPGGTTVTVRLPLAAH
jgi:signal transduction histidine kinase